LPLPANLRGRRAVSTLDRVVYGIIAERRAAGTGPLDLLDMFMNAYDEETGETMSDVQLRDEVLTMLTAGHETTANGLAWTFYLLSKHPDVLRRVQRELDEVLDGDAPSVMKLRELSYTEQVIQEAMRLYPPVWAVARRAEHDDVLSGHLVKRGTYVVMSPYVIQRHPQFWDNPEGFDPDRFSPERLEQARAEGRPKHAYLPFSTGPRKCIGDHFAKMESLIILATLLRKFTPELVPGQRIEMETSVTLRPKHGILMTLSAR
jgi:cytochrome P450